MYYIYSKKGCVQCERVKQYMIDNNKEFTEFVIGQDITMEEFRKLFPKVSVVPVITTQDGLRLTSVSEVE